jgi:erythritol transport system ATP-binding protein
MLGHFFDARGGRVETEATRRILTQPIESLRGRRIVALAGGAMKPAAIRAVLASGLLAGLVTDERTARAIVEGREAEAGAAPAAAP